MERSEIYCGLKETAVLAYSGGLDTSVSIKWLQEKHAAEVVTVTLDVGQKEDLKEVGERAKSLGVARHYSIDAKEEFARGYVFPCIKANGLYEGRYPLSSALTRPLIAAKLVEIATKEGASTVAHGCTGKGNDQLRFDITIRALNPNLKIIAPVREWGMSREEELHYAQKHGIPIRRLKPVYSVDQNLWGRSIEGGPLEYPDQEAPASVFEWTRPLKKTPDEPGYVEISFKEGVPVALDGQEEDPVSLILNLNRLAGRHGVGVIDHVEDRAVGIKSRELYECPAAVCLIEAHRDLEKLVLTRHELHFKGLAETYWAWLVYSGLWVEPLREGLEAFINATQHRVEGRARIKLYKGGLRVVGRSSSYSLYKFNLATYGAPSNFDQRTAEGFSYLWGLQSCLAYALSEKPG